MDSSAIVTAIFSGGVTGAAISAIWNHFSKVWLQRQDANLRAKLAALEDDFQRSQRRVQAEIDRSVFVTRAHFETEFESMKEVFSCLSDVRLTINGVRPMLSVEPPNEAHQERIKRLFERLETLSVAYNKLVAASEARAPFYPAELYDAVDQCLRAASIEITSIKTAGNETFSFAWYQEGERNRNKFFEGYTRAVAIIRDRIAKLTVLPGPFVIRRRVPRSSLPLARAGLFDRNSNTVRTPDTPARSQAYAGRWFGCPTLFPVFGRWPTYPWPIFAFFWQMWGFCLLLDSAGSACIKLCGGWPG